jgi:hypothetical protein
MIVKYRIAWKAKGTEVTSHGDDLFEYDEALQLMQEMEASESGKWLDFQLEEVEVEPKRVRR